MNNTISVSVPEEIYDTYNKDEIDYEIVKVNFGDMLTTLYLAHQAAKAEGPEALERWAKNQTLFILQERLWQLKNN